MMEKNRKTDEQIRRMAAEEPWSAPESCIKHVEYILEELSDTLAKQFGEMSRGKWFFPKLVEKYDFSG